MAKKVNGAALLCTALMQLSVCYGAVYLVGDKTGWTTLGNYDYQGWAANKTFQVGDVLQFVYHKEYHNVLQVTQPEYTSCNVTKPLAAYATGNDSIPLTTAGFHYFLCGVPGHCKSGQKVDVNVSAAPSPTAPASPTSPVPKSSSPTHAAMSSIMMTLLGTAALPFLGPLLL